MRAYVPSDYPEIAGWYEARGKVPPPAKYLPANGLIIPGVAAGFLVSTDTPACWIDSVISNLDAGTMHRGQAVNGIVRGLIHLAHSLGFESITITSQEPSAIRLAKRMAFQSVGNFAMMFRTARTAASGDFGKEQ